MSNFLSKSKFAFHDHCCLCIWYILNFLPLCPSVLEPNFNLFKTTYITPNFWIVTCLLLSDLETRSHLRSLRRWQVLLAFKTFFQLKYLLPSKSCSHLFPPIGVLPTPTILAFMVRIFASFVSLSIKFIGSFNNKALGKSCPLPWNVSFFTFRQW